MAMFPASIERLFEQNLGNLFKRVTQLEQRCQVLDGGNLVTNYVGTIPGSYTSGDPTVVLAGQTAAMGPFPHLTSYTPHANDTVLLLPVAIAGVQSYVIAGTYS